MSGTSPAPRQRGNRQRKNGPVASAPQKSSHQHIQVHHQLAHNIPTPQMAVPNVPRGVTTPPHTPRAKNPEGKKRTRKPRPKDLNMQTPSTYERNDQLPTPVSSGSRYKESTNPFDKQVSTPTTKAYAGPTFHSSPAPSKLPVPSLFSRSVPSGIQEASLSKVMGSSDDSGSASDSSTPSSSPPTSTITIDSLFRRAKEEKEKSRKSSPLASCTPTKNVDLEQLIQGLSLQEPESPSARYSAHHAPAAAPFESALFNMDSDSDRASPAPQRPSHHRSQTTAALNPQFDTEWSRQSNSPFVNQATPIRARVNRAPPQQLASPMSPAFPRHLTERPSPQASPSPNRLLFNMDSYPPSPQHWAQPIERPAYPQHHSSQSYPGPQNPKLRSMEDDLRRMLGIMGPASMMAAETTVA